MQTQSTFTRNQLIAWAAGFIDGEGCVTIVRYRRWKNRRPNPRPTPARYAHTLQLVVGQVDKAPLLRLQSLFGGSIAQYKRLEGINRQPYHNWRTSSQLAAKALRELLPFLTVKAEAARIGLEFQRLLPPTRTGYRLKPGELQIRDTYYQRMRLLHRLGTAASEPVQLKTLFPA